MPQSSQAESSSDQPRHVRLERLEGLLYSRNLTRSALAKSAEVAQSTVNRAIAGKTITYQTAQKIFAALQEIHGGALDLNDYLVKDGRRHPRP